mmetsp:Transcript_37538/g.60524  ORF Transcript_37538/g.60524 Transcript_37538/m.60524 type:complete len:112 (-) Transcript_37538:210-545(-)
MVCFITCQATTSLAPLQPEPSNSATKHAIAAHCFLFLAPRRCAITSARLPYQTCQGAPLSFSFSCSLCLRALALAGLSVFTLKHANVGKVASECEASKCVCVEQVRGVLLV